MRICVWVFFNLSKIIQRIFYKSFYLDDILYRKAPGLWLVFPCLDKVGTSGVVITVTCVAEGLVLPLSAVWVGDACLFQFFSKVVSEFIVAIGQISKVVSFLLSSMSRILSLPNQYCNVLYLFIIFFFWMIPITSSGSLSFV